MSFTSQDRFALQDLAVNYARGLDRRDRPLFLSAFDPGAALTMPTGETMKGHEQIGFVTESVRRYDRTFHFLGQSAYEPPDDGLDPKGTARGEVYCVAYHWTNGKPTRIMYIRYNDVYRQNDEGWLITARRIVVDGDEKHG
jgi:hypothetical protein